ncbi:MAG: flagellar hook-length control protein FliK, partial [candidate division Zixibacteria bacterium]|nr:flagellar hook-length control protein FliK [candidate division Zixibacteria bacterium]
AELEELCGLFPNQPDVNPNQSRIIKQSSADLLNAGMNNNANVMVGTENNDSKLPGQEAILNMASVDSELPTIQMPQKAVAPFELANMTINPDESQLLPGQYKVQSWSIEGKTLHLEVAKPDKPSSPIRVSISIDQMTALNNRTTEGSSVTSGQQRVVLDGAQQQDLSDLLSRYDIKELHISKSSKSLDKAMMPMRGNEIDVEIVAQNIGQELVIKARLPRHAFNRAETNKGGNAKAAAPFEKSVIESNPETQRPVQGIAQRSTVDTQPGFSEDIVQFGKFSKNDEFQKSEMLKMTSSNAKEGAGDTSKMLPDFMHSTKELTLPRERVDLRPVRFEIPENSKMLLKANGQSIRLNIEPKHLGHARLSLHLHNNRLRAMVIVDNTQAKVTIEGSLDRLMDTLNKVNIQVDRIEVNVNQQNANEQFSQQRPHTNWQPNTRRPFSIADNLKEIVEQNPVMPQMETSYVEAGRVNLLA